MSGYLNFHAALEVLRKRAAAAEEHARQCRYLVDDFRNAWEQLAAAQGRNLTPPDGNCSASKGRPTRKGEDGGHE